MAEYDENGLIEYDSNMVIIVQVNEGTIGSISKDSHLNYFNLDRFAEQELGIQDYDSVGEDVGYVSTEIQAGLVQLSPNDYEGLPQGTLERSGAVEIETSEGSTFVQVYTLNPNASFSEFVNQQGGAIPDMNASGMTQETGIVFQSNYRAFFDTPSGAIEGVMPIDNSLHGVELTELTHNPFVEDLINFAEESLVQGSFGSGPEISEADLNQNLNPVPGQNSGAPSFD